MLVGCHLLLVVGRVVLGCVCQPAEREEIRVGLDHDDSLRVIAARLRRSPSTISREVAANGGRDQYRAWRADQRAWQRARRPKPRKLECNRRLGCWVAEQLAQRWSPAQISARLSVEFADDEEMRVSPETIYQTLYLQGRGELRTELAACLRSGRAQRRPHGRHPDRERIRGMVMISERPAEIEDRAVPGHWEGDLIIGQHGKTAIVTLVERTTRLVMLGALPHGRSATHVRDVLTELVQRLPQQLRRSLTWDQGIEMAEHARFRIDSGVQVYFCDPHSPWQRGSNENTNGLLRQYFPKGTPLPTDQQLLDTVAAQLNTRPRQTLQWLKPSEAFNQHIVALTT